MYVVLSSCLMNVNFYIVGSNELRKTISYTERNLVLNEKKLFFLNEQNYSFLIIQRFFQTNFGKIDRFLPN